MIRVCDAEQAQQATCSVTPIMRSQNMVQNKDRLFIDGVDFGLSLISPKRKWMKSGANLPFVLSLKKHSIQENTEESRSCDCENQLILKTTGMKICFGKQKSTFVFSVSCATGRVQLEIVYWKFRLFLHACVFLGLKSGYNLGRKKYHVVTWSVVQAQDCFCRQYTYTRAFVFLDPNVHLLMRPLPTVW